MGDKNESVRDQTKWLKEREIEIKIMTFDDVKKKDVKGQIDWLQGHGIADLPDNATPEEVLHRCASVFLNRKAVVDPGMPKIVPDKRPIQSGSATPTHAVRAKAAGETQVDKELAGVSKSVARRVKAQVEADLKAGQLLPKGQDFPRCCYCSKAMTDKTQIGGESNVTGRQMCTECAAKFPSKLKTKEGNEMPKATSHKKKDIKAGTKKAAKKTVSTKTGRKGNADALKKARGGETIGSFCVRQIKEHKDRTNAEIAEAAAKKFGSKTTPASVAWYRNKVNSGELK
jgi:hypothetical protein